jgi:hypothetical protein
MCRLTASHPVDQFIDGQVVPLGVLLELLGINWIG